MISAPLLGGSHPSPRQGSTVGRQRYGRRVAEMPLVRGSAKEVRILRIPVLLDQFRGYHVSFKANMAVFKIE
ncbi:Hypothetical predicted protein [Cloeon dipterum]|uniref:Uncharacterized protein n=1 Tax=Cloeon dipterum TaxID=197152 RepID=A0A8S1C4B5_9INSE|nr:Hypothetical predicted protein [Cloeon dipterum]